jgi:prepilin-type N-terminal cleavage/methylation domain-containing protein
VKSKRLFSKCDRGFSLVEVIVALVIIATGLAFLSLLFTQQRLNNINSEIRSGAVVFSQRILDHLRQKDPKTLPSIPPQASVSKQCPAPPGSPQTDIDLCPPDLNEANPYSYRANIDFSEDGDCKTTCKKIKVEVVREDEKIYTVETVYTKFE